jgi:hypothetical protein
VKADQVVSGVTASGGKVAVGLQRQSAAALRRDFNFYTQSLKDTDGRLPKPRLISVGTATVKEGDARSGDAT